MDLQVALIHLSYVDKLIPFTHSMSYMTNTPSIKGMAYKIIDIRNFGPAKPL